MRIIFYKAAKGNWIDKLIAWWTSSFKDKFNCEWRKSFSHVELLFSDDLMFSASQYENKTRFKKHNLESLNWERHSISMSYADEQTIRYFCENKCDKKYDYKGILGFIIDIKDDKSKWFCSEICTAALQEVGILNNLVPSKVSPNKLYKFITSLT